MYCSYCRKDVKVALTQSANGLSDVKVCKICEKTDFLYENFKAYIVTLSPDEIRAERDRIDVELLGGPTTLMDYIKYKIVLPLAIIAPSFLIVFYYPVSEFPLWLKICISLHALLWVGIFVWNLIDEGIPNLLDSIRKKNKKTNQEKVHQELNQNTKVYQTEYTPDQPEYYMPQATNNDTPIGIYNGGNGESFENAIIINCNTTLEGIDAEYEWIESRHGKRDVNWKTVKRMHGIEINNKLYEQFDIELSSGANRTIVFDVTSFYGKFI